MFFIFDLLNENDKGENFQLGIIELNRRNIIVNRYNKIKNRFR